MSNEDINRIEKKINLLFKMVFEEKGGGGLAIFNQFADEIIDVFQLGGLDDLKEEMQNFLTLEEIRSKKEEMLQKIELFENGEYVAKEKYTLVKSIYKLIDEFLEMANLYNKQETKRKVQATIDFRNITAFKELRQQLNYTETMYNVREGITIFDKMTGSDIEAIEEKLKNPNRKTLYSRKQQEAILKKLKDNQLISDKDILESFKYVGIRGTYRD